MDDRRDIARLRDELQRTLRAQLAAAPLRQGSGLDDPLMLPHVAALGVEAGRKMYPWNAGEALPARSPTLPPGRAIYVPLLRACNTRALRIMYSAISLEAQETAPHASAPAVCAWRAWQAWLNDPARRPLDEGLAQLLAAQTTAGHFHPLTTETSLDSFVYDEFTTLHALANLAAATRDEALAAAVHRAAAYHVSNTQPDNTTHEPWALAAFAMFADTRSLAEQQMHDVQTFLATRIAAAPAETLVLLADAWVTLGEL